MKKVVPFFLFMAVMLFNTFMVHSLKHDRLPFLSTKSVEAMAWEEMDNPIWEETKLINVDCACFSECGYEYAVGETLQCTYYDVVQNVSCNNSLHGLNKCYEMGQLGIRPLCDTFIWCDLDGVLYIHP